MFEQIGKEKMYALMMHHVDFNNLYPDNDSDFSIDSFRYISENNDEGICFEHLVISVFSGSEQIRYMLHHSVLIDDESFDLVKSVFLFDDAGKYLKDCSEINLDFEEVIAFLHNLDDPNGIFQILGKEELYQNLMLNVFRYIEEGSLSIELYQCNYEYRPSVLRERIFYELLPDSSGCGKFYCELYHHFSPCFENDIFDFYIQTDGRP